VTTSIPVFETTLHKTNEWLADLRRELHTDDRQLAYRVMRAVLHALRDRLTVEEAVQLGAQLPMLLRGVYYEGWDVSTPTNDDRQALFDRIAEEMSDQPGVPDPERWVRAVFTVLSNRIDEGEVRDVIAILPDEMADLWPASVRA
jgi:uncharacterized protein (DUF2267 family)